MSEDLELWRRLKPDAELPVAIRRLVEEVRDGRTEKRCVYDRIHNRHNR
jgi:hypothetical protein